jgi:DNA invertase Pin-like site-specific DNA recombinase
LPKKKQYLAYIRVSTEEQNFDLQYHAIEKWAEREEDIELTVKEEKESTRNTRPVWEEVKKLLRTKEYDGLVTYNLDRIGRSLGQLVLDIEEIVDVHKRDFIMIQNPELMLWLLRKLKERS